MARPRVVVCGVELEAWQLSACDSLDPKENIVVRDNDRGAVLGWVDTEEDAIALLRKHRAIPKCG